MKRYIAAALVALLLTAFSGAPSDGLAKEREGMPAKTFNYDYSTCWWKMNAILKKMPHVTVYYERYATIKLYYIHPNTTDVIVHFTAVDAAHTKVEVESESSSAKNWIARNLFEETVREEEASLTEPYSGSSSKSKDW